MKILQKIIIISLLISPLALYAQDDLENILNNEIGEQTDYTSATFKATRVVNGQSIERMPQGQLDFRIRHRFGTINEKAFNFWGMDQATSHIGLDYGITDWVMTGVGRGFGTTDKAYDGFLKFSIWRQSTGKIDMPVSISWLSSVTDMTNPPVTYPTERSLYPTSVKFAYTNQFLIARKFSNAFSFQLSPTHIHYNLTPTELDPHDLFAMGLSGRIKLSNHVAINGEYYVVYKSPNMSVPITNPLSFGIDIETGGHVFQLLLTNSDGMTEKDFIGRTTGKWSRGDIHFGFNISRVFDVNHHKKF